jgi:hypothetical protein
MNLATQITKKSWAVSKTFFGKKIHNAMGYLLLLQKSDQFCGFPTALLVSIAIQLYLIL